MATWSHVNNKKRYISTSTRPMPGKLDKVEVYSKGPPSIESFDALITWSSLSRDKWKPYISISTRPCLPNLTESWVLMQVYYPSSDITCWLHDNIGSYEKWKMLWSHFHMTCRYQTWQKGDLWIRVTDPTTKPHTASIAWLLQFAWQINFAISLHPRIITNYNKLKNIKDFIIILLKFVFSDIISG